MKKQSIILDGGEYNNIVSSMYKFRRFSFNGKEELMNIFDQPGQLFFKILFHFGTDNDANGLLGISNMDFGGSNVDRVASFKNIVDQSSGVSSYRNEKGEPVGNQTYLANTAFHYLLRNNELTRAGMLVDFVKLLSEISSDYPWYWKSISGLDSLMERKMFSKEFKLEDDPSKITIKCLEDAYDNRIGTLLDLYKSICYDYMNKREIVPANLRKFDMDIYIIQSPTKTMHKITQDNNLLSDSGAPKSDMKYGIPSDSTSLASHTSCKVIELKNCEFVFNSNKTGYGELINDEGFKNEYTIEISVDDAYENRYNEVLGYNIGDFILFNSFSDDGTPSVSAPDESTFKNNILTKLDVSSILNNTVNTVTGKAKNLAKSRLLGNIHGMSLSNVQNFISNPTQSISSSISGAIGQSIDNALAGSNKREELTGVIGKKLPGYPTFEEKMARLKSKFNSDRNLFNSV